MQMWRDFYEEKMTRGQNCTYHKWIKKGRCLTKEISQLKPWDFWVSIDLSTSFYNAKNSSMESRVKKKSMKSFFFKYLNHCAYHMRHFTKLNND